MLKLVSIAFAGVLMVTGSAFAAGGDEWSDKNKMSDGQEQETVIPQESQDAATGQTQETVIPEEQDQQQDDELLLDEQSGQEEPLMEEGAGEEEAY